MKSDDIIRMAHDIVERCAVENDYIEYKNRQRMSAIRRNIPRYTIIIPIAVYGFLYMLTVFSARSVQGISIGNSQIPLSVLTGVFSSMSNVCLIILTLFHKRTGFIISTLILLIGLPSYLIQIFIRHNLTSLPGLFNTIVTVLVLVLIRRYRSGMEDKQLHMQILFEQTAEALVNAIDAKDKYTRGHSSRVADYSRKLAEMNNKNEEECKEIYYAALLHDVGKIGIPANIINKPGKLTEDEYEIIKSHPVLGANILQSISEFPYLSIGARHHHERYDGKGYPSGLKGDDIPEIARIISVADAYDAMTSRRSYRDAIPQQLVREEIVKGTGTQFDPVYARIMLHLIDLDFEYQMRERETIRELAGRDKIIVGEFRSDYSEGILLTPCKLTLSMSTMAANNEKGMAYHTAIVLFDSLDGRIHDSDKEIRNLNYLEYGVLFFDGQTKTIGARKIQTRIIENKLTDSTKSNGYSIEALKIRDHALIRIIGNDMIIENIIAFPDSTRYAYISLTGEHCVISDVSVNREEEKAASDSIPRIADEISYIDVPSGDIPNVQIDGHLTAASEGFEIKDGLELRFYTKCLPTSRLVWHCPYIELFCSEDGIVKGRGYYSLAFVRFDGESWESASGVEIKQITIPRDGFEGWDVWKKRNREGYDALVTFSIEDDHIIIMTENAGIAIKSIITFDHSDKKIYGAVTGDQVAITNIRIEG